MVKVDRLVWENAYQLFCCSDACILRSVSTLEFSLPALIFQLADTFFSVKYIKDTTKATKELITIAAIATKATTTTEFSLKLIKPPLSCLKRTV